MKKTLKQKWFINALGSYLLVVAVLAAIQYTYYEVMPNAWFIQFYTPYEIERVCINGGGNYAIQGNSTREIYPYLPEFMQKTRSIPASSEIEITRNGREIDRIETGVFPYQYDEDGYVEIQNELDVILLPGTYQAVAYVKLLLPHRNTEPPIIRPSNYFTVPERSEVPACE